MIEAFPARVRRRRRARRVVGVVASVAVAAGGVLLAAVVWWPHVSLARDSHALARVKLPALGGRVSRVEVHDESGRPDGVTMRGGRVWPTASLRAGEPVTIRVTVARPWWARWLVGRTEQRVYRVRTPVARLRSRWPEVAGGDQVSVSFQAPVSAVRMRAGGRERTVRLRRPTRTVPLGVVAGSSARAGSALVSAVPRLWERQPRPLRVTWFPVGRHAQALVEPSPAATLGPGHPITLTLSKPLADLFARKRPTLTPSVAGRWTAVDTHTLRFTPAALGYPIGGRLTLRLPTAVAVDDAHATQPTRVLRWHVADGSVLRLQQLLAQAGYLPLEWTPAATADPEGNRAEAELRAVSAAPPGRFTWRFANTPPELKALWHAGRPNEITRAAIMMFQDTHGLDVDSFAGPQVWRALLADTLAGKRRTDGYSYVYVHRRVPQSLNLWHNGRVVVTSPGNTGVPAAPTQLGSFPVFEHIPVGTMSGTNPDGSHYHDPGIRYISYFNHGDAIHAFNRGSFGTPQSLGCVELPLAAAAEVWPYTPIGTLVTIEN